jgi:hypothetical protein
MICRKNLYDDLSVRTMVYRDTVTFLNANVANWPTSPDFRLITQTGSTTQGSAVVAGVDTTGLFDGMSVTGEGIPTGATITDIGTGHVTLSVMASSTGSTTLNFRGFNPNYNYTATDDQVTALTQNSVWTEPVLRYAVDATGLGSVSGTPVGITTPNIAGRNVTLAAGGSIGNLAPPVDVSLDAMRAGPPTLKDGQIAALALATAPGSVLLYGKDSNGNTMYYQLGHQPSGVSFDGVHLIQTAPLFVAASSHFSATGGTSVYVQSTAQDLNIDKVQASHGDASLTAPHSILSAGTSNPQIITSGDLTLLAGSGSLGVVSSTPLVLQVGGVLDAATAQQNIK